MTNDITCCDNAQCANRGDCARYGTSGGAAYHTTFEPNASGECAHFIDIDIPSALRAWRGDRRQHEVAPLLGVAVSQYSHWESGRHKPIKLWRDKIISVIRG